MYCKPSPYGIKSVSCRYPPVLERKVLPDNLQLKIINMVCWQMQISEYDILSKSRSTPLPDARSIAMTLIYKYADVYKSDIAKTFGKDHSTVIFALNKCQDLLDTDKKFKENYLAIEKRVQNFLLKIK